MVILKKQSEREGGHFLIPSPEEGSAAGLSALPFELLSGGKGSKKEGDGQEWGEKKEAERKVVNIFRIGQRLRGRLKKRKRGKTLPPLKPPVSQMKRQVLSPQIFPEVKVVKKKEMGKRVGREG